MDRAGITQGINLNQRAVSLRVCENPRRLNGFSVPESRIAASSKNPRRLSGFWPRDGFLRRKIPEEYWERVGAPDNPIPNQIRSQTVPESTSERAAIASGLEVVRLLRAFS